MDKIKKFIINLYHTNKPAFGGYMFLLSFPISAMIDTLSHFLACLFFVLTCLIGLYFLVSREQT